MMMGKLRRLPKWVFALPLLLAAAILLALGWGNREAAVQGTGAALLSAQAEIGSITNIVNGSGTVQPIEQYDIVSLVQGDILTDSLEIGQSVAAGDFLYRIDSTDAQNNIEKSRVALERQQLSYEESLENAAHLTVTAPFAGTVTAVNVKKGDQAGNNAEVATVVNAAEMLLTLPFNAADARELQVGQEGTVYLEETGESFTAAVRKIASGAYVTADGAQVSEVELVFANPGALLPGNTATAQVGGLACQAAGVVAYSEEKIVRAQVSGEVAEVPVAVGDSVAEGETLAVLTNKSTEVTAQSGALALRDAQLSLANMEKQLDDYNIASPIAGTVIAKSYKAGDTLDSNRTVLAVVADMSSLVFTMNIDELDIRQIAEGQEATVTADAVADKSFQGRVRTIGLMGTSSNGVTTYPVEVVIETYEGLLPGMNVSADIVAARAENVLVIPAAAVQRGNLVLVKEEYGGREGVGETVEREGAPEGYIWVRVSTGLTDGDMVEISAGLVEGAEIIYTPPIDSSGTQNFTFNVMPGGGGGMPPGGGGGGGMIIRQGGGAGGGG
ncbi:MAG: HlyD family efflux transporter periplasmic adaptor subunit [Gracilibacteraceae bacterium]|jgi:HlyD family secretion protein|nr:HlyD family efflux transporter periplasmic adaptor subunit [Gracilibacteraceae bacterium]